MERAKQTMMRNRRKKIKCGQISGHSWTVKQFYSCVSRYLNKPEKVQSTSDIFRNAEWWGVREGWSRGGETWARKGQWRHQGRHRSAWGQLLWQAGGLKQRPRATWKEKVMITFPEVPTHQIQVEATESECGKPWEGGINPRSLHLSKKADGKKPSVWQQPACEVLNAALFPRGRMIKKGDFP